MQKFPGIPVGNFMMTNSREFPNGNISGGLAANASAAGSRSALFITNHNDIYTTDLADKSRDAF